MFADAWSEMLRPEIQNKLPIWAGAGTISGGILGFILGNVPGAIGGALLGGKLGAVRDAKGKAVSEVFLSLSSQQRAEILRDLAAKVFNSIK